MADLLAQAADALRAALAAVHHKTDFSLQTADFGAGFIQRALGLVDFITGGVMGLPHLLQISLGLAQIGGARFQRIGRLRRLGQHTGLFSRSLGALQKPLLLLLVGHVFLQRLELHGRLSLLFEFAEVGAELAQDVLHAGQVLARVGNPVLGFAATLFVFGYPGGLFEEQAQLFGTRLDDAADGALADDGVGARAQTGAQKHVLYIAAAHGLVIDEIAGSAIPREGAAHRDLGELAPLPADAVVGVVKQELHAGTAGGFALGGAVEDNVLHGLAAQLAGTALAQNPAHRVHNVGLTTAIGPDHAHQLPRQLQVRRLGKGLEAGELDGVKAHGGAVFPERGTWSYVTGGLREAPLSRFFDDNPHFFAQQQHLGTQRGPGGTGLDQGGGLAKGIQLLNSVRHVGCTKHGQNPFKSVQNHSRARRLAISQRAIQPQGVVVQRFQEHWQQRRNHLGAANRLQGLGITQQRRCLRQGAWWVRAGVVRVVRVSSHAEILTDALRRR